MAEKKTKAKKEPRAIRETAPEHPVAEVPIESLDDLKANCSGWISFSSQAMLFLLYVALPSFLLSIFLLVRIGTPQVAYWTSVVVLAAVIFLQRKKLGVGDYIVFFGLMALCHLYAYCAMDLSTDGLAYHQPAVRRIADGFNPIVDGYMILGRIPDMWGDQATYFPKALWYFSASVTAALGDIQFGKVYGLLLILASLFFVLDALKKESLTLRAVWAAACLNPVALSQIPQDLADGALASLVTISLFYAWLFFTGRPVSRFQHVFCTVALAMLFCVKTSGFGFGGIVLFFIALHSLVKTYRDNPALAVAARLAAACKTAVRQGIRTGGPVLLLVLVWGFSPYATNIMDGKNIFYPIVSDGSERSGFVQIDTERGAKAVYPDADNRVTRLLCSITSHTMLGKLEAKVKSPLDMTLEDWSVFGKSYHVRAAGLGPLFYLLLLLSVPALCMARFRGNGWLLCTLLTLIFVQPYSWLMRFAPFLWILPLACLMPLSGKWRTYIWLPVSVAFINTLGVAYFVVNTTWNDSSNIKQVCAHFAGETVMLPQTIYEYAGIFDRYKITQKYVNPEDTDLASVAQGVGWGLMPAPRLQDGVNIFVKRNLPPLPERGIVFSNEAAMPWIGMSDGLRPSRQQGSPRTQWLSTGDKIKFYMALDREPQEDWELILRGGMFDDWRSNRQRINVLVYVNNREVGSWQVDRGAVNSRTVTLTVPRDILEESFKDETRLVTLMLRVQGAPSIPGRVSIYGLQLESMRFRPKDI